MFTIAGGIILAVLFFIFLPSVLELVEIIVRALLAVTVGAVVVGGIGYAFYNYTILSLVLTGFLAVSIGINWLWAKYEEKNGTSENN